MELQPIKGNIYITSPYGMRTDPIDKTKKFHNGVDIGANIGTPILAVADGKVAISKVNGGGPKVGYGYYIAVQHKGFITLSAHLKQLGLPVGTTVKKGQVIGYTGNSGRSTGPHLHFEVHNTDQITNTFFNKDAIGKMATSVNPETFETLKEERPYPDVPDWALEAWQWSVEAGINDGIVQNETEIQTVKMLYEYHRKYHM